MVYADGNNNGVIEPTEILEEHHYYPFGLEHQNYSTITGNTGYKYTFGGKEFQHEKGMNMYDFGARNYDPALGRWMNIDPLAEEMRRFTPYNYAFNNPIRFTDPDGMAPEDLIDIDKNTGSLKITPKKGKDVVRLIDEGKVVSSYTYGENGSFRNDTTIERNDLFEKTEMRVHFQNVDKAKEFYEFAAKSDPEFGYVDIFYSSDLSSQTTVLTNGGRSSVRASDYAYSVLEKNSDAYLLDISHSHPGKYLPNDGHYPAVPSGFDDNLKPTSRPGDRQGYIRGNKYDGRRPDYYNIFIPSKPTIKLKYNGDRVIRKL